MKQFKVSVLVMTLGLTILGLLIGGLYATYGYVKYSEVPLALIVAGVVWMIVVIVKEGLSEIRFSKELERRRQEEETVIEEKDFYGDRSFGVMYFMGLVKISANTLEGIGAGIEWLRGLGYYNIDKMDVREAGEGYDYNYLAQVQAEEVVVESVAVCEVIEDESEAETGLPCYACGCRVSVDSYTELTDKAEGNANQIANIHMELEGEFCPTCNDRFEAEMDAFYEKEYEAYMAQHEAEADRILSELSF